MSRAWRIGLVGVAAVLAGCSPWREGDASAAGAMTPGVDTVRVEGRQHLRLRSMTAVALIDQRGGRVVSYRMQRRLPWLMETKSKEERARIEADAKYAAGPETLASGAWRAVSVGGGAKLDEATMWQVDTDVAGVTLLSPEVEGLRWRKEFRLGDDGVLSVTCQLENVGWKAREAGAASELGGVKAAGGRAETVEVSGATLTRELTEEPDGAEGFRFAARKLEHGQSIRWVETWRIRETGATTQPVR